VIRYAITYITTGITFVALDMLWMTQFAGPLYRKTLGVVLLENFRIAPAFLFYLLFIAGIMIFVVPREEGWQTPGQTFGFGALFGLFTYGTFDLTSYTIIEAWTPYLLFTDLAWGIFLTGIASMVGSWVAEQILHRLFAV
jgi:uncharacterized membrane protein